MNQPIDRLDIELDRLVDGELSPAEYQLLLGTLDAQPQGWRRCALAFIEAQAMRGGLRELRSECLTTIRPIASPIAAPALKRAGQGWWIALAMAAGFLLALPLGRFVFPNSERAPTVVVDASKPTPRIPPDGVAHSSTDPLGRLRLTTDDGQVDIPYYDIKNGAQYLRNDQGVIAEEVVESLQRAGHRVERAPTVMPVDLEDGGRVYLPVDNYRITPVSNRPIQ